MAKYEFQSMLKGYNRYQVDDYLDRLNEELDSYKQKLSLYEQRCEQLEEINKDVKEKYQLLLNEVRVREKAAEDIGRLALKEANIIVSTAQSNADVIIHEALASARQILLEVSKLGEETGEIKTRMMNQLNDLTRVLEGFEVPELPAMDLLEDDEKYDEIRRL